MRTFFSAIALLALVPSMSMAQDTTNSSQTSASGAAANGTVVANVETLTTSPQHSTVWTTPSVQGSFFSGANPCLIGTGGGAAGGPVGFSLNFGKNDKGCQRRSDAAAWHAMGFDSVAIARMCQDLASADAFYAAIGEVCPGADQKRYKLPDGTLPRIARIENHPATH